MIGFIFVTISALFHAGWNVLLKKSKAKFRFNMNMHIASVLIFTVVLFIFYRDTISFAPDVMLAGLIAAVFFATYHLFVAKAYELSDVSQVYPITTSSPLFVTIWAAIFLGEHVTLLGVVGVLVTISGCFIMNGASLGRLTLNAGVLMALASAFSYSFGALFDKVGVNTGNAVMYTYWMNFFMTSFFVIMHFLKHKAEKPCKDDRKYIFIAGVVIVASSLTYRFGIIEMPISYAVAVRQISGLFGVLMGIIFFHEGYGWKRIIGALVIISGIVLLRLGV